MQRINAKDDAVEGGENGERPPSSQPIAPAVAGQALRNRQERVYQNTRARGVRILKVEKRGGGGERRGQTQRVSDDQTSMRLCMMARMRI